jgi:hypothetical protein
MSGSWLANGAAPYKQEVRTFEPGSAHSARDPCVVNYRHEWGNMGLRAPGES